MAVNATAIWRVRPSGSNTNGGGYDPGIAGAATDYSQQNAAQATGTHGVTVGTTDFADATFGAFTSAMIGNAIYITGAGQATGFYFVTAVPGATHVTLDRSPGTGVNATWNLGGGWADPATNTDTSGNFGSNGATWVVPGNKIFLLGSGTPNPSSYTYDYTIAGNYFTPPSGNNTAGYIVFANDPATPGYKAPPDTTGGMPVITSTYGLMVYQAVGLKFEGLYCVAGGATNKNFGFIYCTGYVNSLGCVFDQFAIDMAFQNGASSFSAKGCEVFSSVAPGANGINAGLRYIGGSGTPDQVLFMGCNVHDTVGPGIDGTGGLVCLNNIVAKCRGNGIQLSGGGSDTNANLAVVNNIIDANIGSGILIPDQQTLGGSAILNNIISNHTQAATYGITISAGTSAANSLVQQRVDYNSYYNNTANYNAINAGPHDTALVSNPYIGQGTENYTYA